jgi:hypothetical protein
MNILNTELIALIRLIHQDKDTDCGHQKTIIELQLISYRINYKKVYRPQLSEVFSLSLYYAIGSRLHLKKYSLISLFYFYQV